ncbi:MAG: FAD-dependent oxidoreductase, partial [Pseudomonadales bacterium]|nr:FAD-dependent oxidoreductase [Pseudomonadales bacterium]
MSDCCDAENNPARAPDILVIGAGSAGFSAAITAADNGAKVVIAGAGVIGGTGVNVGCVPSKTLIRATEAVHKGKDVARFHGLRGAAEILNWRALVEQKQELVDSLRQAKYKDLLPEYPDISYVVGRARFTGNGSEVDVDGSLYHPRKIVLATGASAALPPINGIQNVPVLDSTRALELETLPASLLIIGVGVIGCVLCPLLSRAGINVTICCRSWLLPA